MMASSFTATGNLAGRPKGENMSDTVKIRVCHATSDPRWIWIEPVDWYPITPGALFGARVVWVERAWWDANEEHAAIAVARGDLGEANVGEVRDVPVSSLAVLSAGDCRVLDGVEVRRRRAGAQ